MITLESIKEAVAATEKEGNEGWRAMQRLDRRSVEYIKWLIDRVERLDSENEKLLKELRREDTRYNDHNDKLHSLVDKLEADLAKYKKVIIEALRDDYHQDHSSGCWQGEAKTLLGLEYEEDEDDVNEILEQTLKEIGEAGR